MSNQDKICEVFVDKFAKSNPPFFKVLNKVVNGLLGCEFILIIVSGST